MKICSFSGELQFVCEYVSRTTGVELDLSKDYLIHSRLGPILRLVGASNYIELINRALDDKSGNIRNLVVDAITTHETSFFRDERPFLLLTHKLVPDILQSQLDSGYVNRPHLDIWCAGCSTGQEVYSIAITLKELLFDFSRYQIRIVGTDISEGALSVASCGFYTHSEVRRGLSDKLLNRYFIPQPGGWTIVDELRSLATFRPLNFMDTTWNVGTFDMIFCRNVSFYFSVMNRKRLFNQMSNHLHKDGCLIVGSTENISGLTPYFVREEFRATSYYRKVIP